jgi:hypothetical protein
LVRPGRRADTRFHSPSNRPSDMLIVYVQNDQRCVDYPNAERQ